MISIVVPVYGCRTMLAELYLRVKKTFADMHKDFELILVNDNGPDNAWETIAELSLNDKRVKGIKLSRNFGQHYAISAGLSYAKGEWVVVMDCDLQDQPEEIPRLYAKAMEGYEAVLACRESRQDSFLKRQSSKLFYWTLAYLTGTEQNEEVANYGIYHRKLVQAVLSMHDKIKYFPAMVKWVGFRQIGIPVAHAERAEGKSSYSFKRLLMLALDTILSFSDKPLRLIVKFGAILSLLTILFSIYILIQYFLGNIHIQGYASIIMSTMFLSGVIITVIGMVGLYVGRTFEQVKNRPVFIVAETTNTEL